ncbi:MAG: sigma-70 family RNA polymerase sigma factor [Kiritimatiellaeota bacterium]|nr:sigma-70 family RNA polymerase sigma factor [Kiritimatiellota bacterium]
MDDKKNIEATLAGDTRAFAALVRKYQAVTYAVALQRVGNAADAEEIVQDVFSCVYRKLDQLKDAARFGAWLRSITLRQCGMHLRAKSRKLEIVALPAEALDSVEDVGRQREAMFDVETLIGELPEGLKAAAVLCLSDDVSPAAAAAMLGLKPGTLRKRLHDARARLQRRIVEKAEKEIRLHLLPKDFAERCVCRCEKARASKAGKEVNPMAENKKKDCGCGCLGKAKAKGKTEQKEKNKK